MGLFTSNKSSLVNLKTELKKLIFEEPLVICEDSAVFTMVMSTFKNYEKDVSNYFIINFTYGTG